MTQKVLVVDDDPAISEMLTLVLSTEGFASVVVNDGGQAVEVFQRENPDLVLLDLMLPGMNGIDICRAIRQESTVPIVMLTAKTDTVDVVLGLESGADDYIPKPFNPLELVARVKAQLRRYTQYNDGGKIEGDVIDFAGVLLNRTSHECIFNERSLTLTPIEFDILWLLCENRGKVISSEELFRKVWKEEYYKNSNNTVMVHIRHLREKMSGPTGKSDFIKTVWGVGYKVEE